MSCDKRCTTAKSNAGIIITLLICHPRETPDISGQEYSKRPLKVTRILFYIKRGSNLYWPLRP